MGYRPHATDPIPPLVGVLLMALAVEVPQVRPENVRSGCTTTLGYGGASVLQFGMCLVIHPAPIALGDVILVDHVRIPSTGL